MINWQQLGGIELADIDGYTLVACGDGTWGVHRPHCPPLATGKTTDWDSARGAAVAAMRDLKAQESEDR